MLALPHCDLSWLKRRVANFAEDRPGVYRMVAPDGRIVYVGKAKKLRTRLLSYFRAAYPDDKAARILHAASDIHWEYVPSDFAALLKELRHIQRFRPVFNVRMNRPRQTVLIKVAGGAAPKIFVGATPGKQDVRHYGPFTSRDRAREAVKALNDLLELRDCATTMPIAYAEQGDLFEAPSRAACLRHELGTCSGPCAGHVTEEAYRRRVQVAIDFLEGRAIAPLDRVVGAMVEASEANDFERARWWRDRFDALEWLLDATVRARAALQALSFIYFDPGVYGDDMAYLIRRGTVCAVAPAPRTPIEVEAFRSVVREQHGLDRDDGPIPRAALEEVLLLTRWFNGRPQAMRRTVPIDAWLDDPNLTPADLHA